jgi:spermidine/putrescine transport system permease protein
MTTRRTSGLGLYFSLYVAFLYAPVLVLPVFSLNDSPFVAFPLKGFTLEWYEQLFTDARLRQALINSLLIAVIAAVVSTVAGTLTAYSLTRRHSAFARLVMPAALVPLAIPGVMLGIGLLVVANVAGVGPSLTAITLAHIAICLPLTTIIMRGRFMTYSPSIEEAATDLGASEWRVFAKVSLPIVWPGVFSCLILAFTMSFDEFIVTNFLVGTEQTLPLFIWTNLRYIDRLPRTLALGTAILIVSTCLVVWAELLQRRGPSNGKTTGEP